MEEGLAVPASSVIEAAVRTGALPHLIQGARDTGKTHLLLASCYAARESGKSVAYIALRQSTERLLEQAEGAGLIAVDDVDAIEGNLDAQVALFHLFNAVQSNQQTLLLSSIGSPSSMNLQLPDLKSRLGACVRVPLTMLSDEGRKKALQVRAHSRGLEFDDAAIDWLLLRADRSVSSLMTLFRQLDHASSVRQKKLTLPFVREILSDQL